MDGMKTVTIELTPEERSLLIMALGMACYSAGQPEKRNQLRGLKEAIYELARKIVLQSYEPEKSN